MSSPYLRDALLDHARRYVWANPMVDSQAIFKLNRLTRPNFPARRMSVAGREVLFPTPHVYIAYALSALPERWFGVTENLPAMRWYRAADLMNQNNVLFQFYTTRGLMVPMAHIYFYKQINNNIIIAIREDKLLPDFADSLYFRVYSNAVIIEAVQPRGAKVGEVLALQIRGTGDMTVVANQRIAWEQRSEVEQTLLYVNGVLRRNFENTQLKVGDYVDLIYDDTIKAVRTVDIDPTRTYESIQDNCVKYIISRGKANGAFDYFDDVDFFLYDDEVDCGYYYHRNTEQNVRQLTHGDYGLPTWNVHGYLHFDQNALKSPSTKMVLYTRDTLGEPQIGNVHCRIKTLYRLPEKDIRLELSSPVGQLPEWQAKHLEVDPYNVIVNYPNRDLPIEQVALAYGYHGVVEAIGNPLHRPTTPVLYLPKLYQEGGLAICHFDTGVEFHPIVLGMRRLDWGNRVPKLVYLLAGEILNEEIAYTYPVKVPREEGKTWYWFDKEHPERGWEVIRNKELLYLEEDGWRLNMDQSRYQLSYRTGREILKHTETIVVTSPYVAITLPTFFWGYRHVDIYLGDKKLIPDLHFILNDQVVQYVGGGLEEGEVISFTVVASGVIPDGGKVNMDYEVGFVIDGCVSYDNGHFLFGDRYPLINVDGNLLLKHEVDWHEEKTGHPQPNVKPYVIETKYPSIQAVIPKLEIDLLGRSLELDDRLSNYLDFKYPLPKLPTFDLAEEPLLVVSAFLSWVYENRKQLLFGLREDLPMSQIKSRLDSHTKRFNHDELLQQFDARYIRMRIHGFPIGHYLEVTQREYEFLDKVNQHYLTRKVLLSECLVIRSEHE